MKDPILRVKNLTAELAGEIILNGLSFEVKEDETLVVLGPNGAGKTVLLRVLLGLVSHQGEISWKEGVKIGYVPQRLPFVKDIPLSVKEFFSLKKIKPKEATKLLEEVGIREEKFMEKELGKISSGQFQRVLIAWALGDNPQVLLFDEPTAGIDIEGEKTVYNLLEKLQKERNLTILLVSHDLTVVYKLASRVLCLNKKMLCFGPPQDILTAEKISQLYGGEMKFYTHNHND